MEIIKVQMLAYHFRVDGVHSSFAGEQILKYSKLERKHTLKSGMWFLFNCSIRETVFVCFTLICSLTLTEREQPGDWKHVWSIKRDRQCSLFIYARHYSLEWINVPITNRAQFSDCGFRVLQAFITLIHSIHQVTWFLSCVSLMHGGYGVSTTNDLHLNKVIWVVDRVDWDLYTIIY